MDETFACFRAVYLRHAAGLHVAADTPTQLSLEAPATAGAPSAFFGRVELRPTGVSAHLMPVYTHPALLNGVPEALRRRMTGKSCFRFTARDLDLAEPFDALVAAAAAHVRGGPTGS